jgi:hypothetical protein
MRSTNWSGWLLTYPAVATIIAGVARPGQAKVTAESAGWYLTPVEADEVVALAAGSPGRPRAGGEDRRGGLDCIDASFHDRCSVVASGGRQ